MSSKPGPWPSNLPPPITTSHPPLPPSPRHPSLSPPNRYDYNKSGTYEIGELCAAMDRTYNSGAFEEEEAPPPMQVSPPSLPPPSLSLSPTLPTSLPPFQPPHLWPAEPVLKSLFVEPCKPRVVEPLT